MRRSETYLAHYACVLSTALAVGSAGARAHDALGTCGGNFPNPVPIASASETYVDRFTAWDLSGSASVAADSAIEACETECQQKADVALQSCVTNGQTPQQCVEAAQNVRNSCLSSICQLTPFEPPCELSCHAQAQQVFSVCLTFGRSEGECSSIARDTLNQCLIMECNLTPQASPCLFSCHLAAEQTFQQCLETKENDDSCPIEARIKLNACLENACHVPAPESACVTACHRQAEQMFHGCVMGGLTHVSCAGAAGELMESCQRTQCGLQPLSPPCESRCDQDGEDLFYDCLQSDHTQAECADMAGSFRQECLEDRCGAESNCGSNCPRKRLVDLPHDGIPRRRDRRTAPAAETFRDERIVELLETSLGVWAPTNPAVDLFAGQFKSIGSFVRLDLRFDGLVNPPGTVDPNNFKPNQYGPRPVYGFVEIDMDNSIATGGELDAPQYRYLGNVARFGGQVSPMGLRNRVALDATAFDRNFVTPPFVERSGEEFHLALLGGEAVAIRQLHGDGDGQFERGEAWLLTGAYFHRAHGYERFSLVEGGRMPGQYMPLHKLLFVHDVIQNVTTVSLVFPLTNFGTAQTTGDPQEPINSNPSDQASILEGLADLQESASFVEIFPTSDPAQALISNWKSGVPSNVLNPKDWRVTVIVGTNHPIIEPSQALFVWTDVFPNVVSGDVDGSGERTDADVQAIRSFITTADGRDGRFDAMVVVRDFSAGFSLFDVNNDGVVDFRDFIRENGDADVDGDIDLADFATQQSCFGRAGAYTPCVSVNFSADDMVDLDDIRVFGWSLDGPQRR